MPRAASRPSSPPPITDGAARPEACARAASPRRRNCGKRTRRQLPAGDRRNVRARAGADHQLGIAPAPAELVLDRLCGAVDADDALVVVLGDRGAGRERGFVDTPELHVAGEQRRQLDAVVGRPALGVEENDGNPRRDTSCAARNPEGPPPTTMTGGLPACGRPSAGASEAGSASARSATVPAAKARLRGSSISPCHA